MSKANYKDHGEGFGVSWQVYPADTTIEQIEADGWELGGRSGGPGRPFTSTVSVRRTKTRVLVLQPCGIDV